MILPNRALLPAIVFGAVLPIAAPAAAQTDTVGSYAGVSIGIDRTLPDNLSLGVDAAYAFTENFQLRGTLGDGVGIVAPTVSFSKGDFRVAAGPGLRWADKKNVVPVFTEEGELATNSEGFPQTEIEVESQFGVIGLLAAEAAVNDYMVVYANAIISDDVSGAIGVGIRF